MKKRQIKKTIKNAIHFFSYHIGVTNLFLKILTKARKTHPCVILLYHRIVDDNTQYLDKGPGMHHHIRDFEKEIPYLKKHYQLLPMDEVVARIESGKGFDRPTVAITFDDGYLDNFTLAYPVLQKHGVPATIYLATSLIGSEGRTWTDQIELALLQTQREYFLLPELYGEKNISIRTKLEKQAVCIELASKLKSMPDRSRKEILPRILKKLGANGGAPCESGPRMMLSWDEVRKMAGNGITIGSHSHTHPILSRMPIQKAKEEIFNSKQAMENNLGFGVKHFSFPNGRREDFAEELRDYCREIGFESVASVIYGTNDIKNGSEWNLKRIVAVSPVWVLGGELIELFLRNPKDGQNLSLSSGTC